MRWTKINFGFRNTLFLRLLLFTKKEHLRIRVRLYFKDGSVGEIDLLIGADGNTIRMLSELHWKRHQQLTLSPTGCPQDLFSKTIAFTTRDRSCIVLLPANQRPRISMAFHGLSFLGGSTQAHTRACTHIRAHLEMPISRWLPESGGGQKVRRRSAGAGSLICTPYFTSTTSAHPFSRSGTLLPNERRRCLRYFLTLA